MPSEDNMVLKFTEYFKTTKALSLLYADIKSLTKKIIGCENNPEKSSTTNELA